MIQKKNEFGHDYAAVEDDTLQSQLRYILQCAGV